MAKDPAFLFYFRDFLVSVELMSFEEIGQYIKILCHMADKGRLNKEDMQSICKAHGLAQRLQSKFKVDQNGLFFNERLELEVEKRKLYSESRRDNAKHMHKHMGNGNENANKDIIKDVLNEDDFENFWNIYPRKVGKKKSLESWNRLVKTKEMIKKILSAVENQKEWPQWKKEDGQFIPHPATWLNQGRWDDEYKPTKSAKLNLNEKQRKNIEALNDFSERRNSRPGNGNIQPGVCLPNNGIPVVRNPA